MLNRVLIADDSAVARAAVARRLRASGREVLEHDSVASVSEVDPCSIACALLDFDLGDGSGIDVAARLRAARHELPIAFFTSTSDSSALDRAGAFGPVFLKPNELDVALAWVERHLVA